MTQNAAPRSCWDVGTEFPPDDSDAKRQQLAAQLAMFIVEERLPPIRIQQWKLAAYGERGLNHTERLVLGSFLHHDFGRRGEPHDENHLQGAVAESLWRRFLNTSARKPLRVEGHDLSVTDPGGDGLAIYQGTRGLFFRLWEVKKHLSEAALGTTTARASAQLRERGLDYLARFSGAFKHETDPALLEFLGQLGELWVERSDTAGAGIAIATSNEHLDGDVFDVLEETFPEFCGRLEAYICAFQDFRGFCSRVQEEIWKGL